MSDIKINSEQSIDYTIWQVANKISKIGIGKNKVNTHQSYKFRGIDDIYDNLAPIYAEFGLYITKKILSVNKNIIQGLKSISHYVETHIEYTIRHVHNGQVRISEQLGHAIDTSDKAANKASSAAMKYLAIELFSIPLVGSEDADFDHIEQDTKTKTSPEITAINELLASHKFQSDIVIKTQNMLNNNHSDVEYTALLKRLREIKDKDMLAAVTPDNVPF